MSIIDKFFSIPSDTTLMRFRIALSALIILHLLILFPHLNEYFTDDGYITAQEARSYYGQIDWSIFFYFTSYPSVLSVWFLGFIGAIFIGLGIYPQIFCGFSYIILTSFLNRFPNISYGGFIFLGIALLFSIFLPLSRGWTIPHAQKLKFNQIHFPHDIAAWAARMIQLEVCIIYFFAGVMKLQNPHWLDGSQLLYTLNLFGAYWDFTWLQHYPVVTAFMTISSLLLEILFPVMIFIPAIRNYWILGLICMHIGIGLTMNVTFLGETMIGLLMIFL